MQTYLHERIDEVLTNGTTENVAVYVYGSDFGTLQSIASKLSGQMGKIPGLVDVQPAPLEFVPEADVTVNVAAAQKYGLTPGDVRRFAAVEMSSEPVATITWNGQVINVAAWTHPGRAQ